MVGDIPYGLEGLSDPAARQQHPGLARDHCPPQAIDQIRGASRRAVPIDNLPERATAHDLPVDDELRSALRQLTEKQQHAVVYRHIGDLSYDDIAELLQCSKDAARRSVADGLIKLRDIYGERIAK
jgi:RNA polymerase sigma factor (sigma-70 family)